MRFAYADPPYIGQAKKHYNGQSICAEVNHRVLLGHLCEHYDGWALSCSSPSLKHILSLDTCPDDVRVAAWVKPFASFKPGVNPAYAWEPVLFYGAKKRGRDEDTVRDWVAENIALQKGLPGAKPTRFAFWLFDLLGIDAEEDTLDDLFPGTGIIGDAFEAWRLMRTENQLELF